MTADRKVAVADDCEEVTVGRAAAEELFESPPPGAEENIEEGLPPFPGEWRLALKHPEKTIVGKGRALLGGFAPSPLV